MIHFPSLSLSPDWWTVVRLGCGHLQRGAPSHAQPDIWPPGLRALEHRYSRDQQNSSLIFVHNLETGMVWALINQQNIDAALHTKPNLSGLRSPKQPQNHRKWTTSFAVDDCMSIARRVSGPGQDGWYNTKITTLAFYCRDSSERRNVSFPISPFQFHHLRVGSLCYLYPSHLLIVSPWSVSRSRDIRTQVIFIRLWHNQEITRTHGTLQKFSALNLIFTVLIS